MEGLLLRLLDDARGSPARWFWPCFEPLRSEFDRYFWVFLDNPWMGSPSEFDSDREIAAFVGMERTSTTLWRPGAVRRWADSFCEESIDLWAVDPEDDPARTAADFDRASYDKQDAFIDQRGVIRLIYTDSFCWEIFANARQLLTAVRNHVEGSDSIRVYETCSLDRQPALDQATRLREHEEC